MVIEFVFFMMEVFQFLKVHDNEAKNEKRSFREFWSKLLRSNVHEINGKIALMFCKLTFLWLTYQIVHEFS